MRQVWFATQRSLGGARSSPLGARLRALGLSACAVALAATSAMAQAGVVEGVVTDPGQSPIASAQVTVSGTRLGSITDESGHFTIAGISGTTATLEVRRLGYRGDTVTARVGDRNVHVTLVPAAINLNTVVVTGTPGATQKRELGVSVAQIDAANVVAKAPAENVQEVINGRAPGVAIVQNSGMIGAGANVTIRGLSSFSLTNQPLIYVDGVRVDNAQGTGPVNQGFGASTTTRWNDFNPEDIQSIEIVKGPAATTLYGTQAANGVIQIITKKGAEGKPRWDFTTRQGLNWFANPEGRLWVNYGLDSLGNVASIDQVDRYDAKGTPIFQNGRLQTYNIGVGGGTSAVRYHVDGGFRNDAGVLPGNKQRLYSTHGNLSIIPSDKVDIATSLGYVTGRTDLAWESGAGGTPWTTYYATPQNLYGPSAIQDGFWSAPPFVYYTLFSDWQNIDRFTGSVQLNHHPTAWFSQHLTFGADIGREYNEELDQVHHDLAQYFEFEADSGYVAIDTRNNNLATFSYNATVTLPITSHLTSNTTAGGDFYKRTTTYTSGYGQDFPAPGLTALSSTTAQQSAGQSQVQQNSVGLLVQEKLGWNDRLFLTGGFRVDNNSAFGANFNRVYYPKVDASWIISDEPFFHVPFVSQLKLRAAYGQSGLAPVPYSAVATFGSFVGSNGSAVVTPQSIGNANLKPETGYETELGFDMGLLEDRAGVEFTFFDGGTKNAILERQVPPSLGYPGTQFVNAGHISKHGIEVLLRGTPIQTASTSWDLTFSAGWNHTNVDNLGGQTFISPGTYIQHHIGYPVGAWFGPKVVSAQFDSAGNTPKADMMCAGGPDNGNKPVPCYSSTGSLVAPNVFLGRTTPNLEGSFSTTLRVFKNLSFYALADFKHGYSKLDGNRRVRCWFFSLCRENYFPTEFSPVKIAGIQHELVGDLISDASFTKLREVSATYSLPEPWAGRLGASHASVTVAGRNLFTWTHYKGLEPEASFEGGGRGTAGQWEQDVLPQLTQFVATVNLTF